MIFKCTHCSGRLKYDIKSRKLRCESCSQLVEFPEIVDTEYIFDEYRCTLCGARLYVNEDDMTSECPYCGAQSVVLEKKNARFMPDGIIPFKINKEVAKSYIVRKFSKYKCTLKDIRNIDIEDIRPIYLPYLVVGCTVNTDQLIEGTKYEIFGDTKYRARRAATIKYDNIPLNATKMLKDEVMNRLEPWKIDEEQKFNPIYLSGMYAGFLNVSVDEANQKAEEKIKGYVDKTVIDSCRELDHPYAVSKKYQADVNYCRITLFPIWFFKAKYGKQEYSAIVNGQTGKCVSAVAANPYEFVKRMLIVTALSYIPFYEIFKFIWIILGLYNSGETRYVVLGIELTVLVFTFVGIFAAASGKMFRKYQKAKNIFQSEDMLIYTEKGRKK